MIDIERVKIAKKIRNALDEKGVILPDLAKEYEITPGALHHVINGHRGRTGENAITIALGFDPWVEFIKRSESNTGTGG